jgi:type I restriction enzyme M protein
MPKGKNNHNAKITSQAGLDRAVWSICDILRRDKAKGARLYVPELTWMLFLNALDQKEAEEEARARVLGAAFAPSIASPYRWRDWAAQPDDPLPLFRQNGFQPGWKRRELTEGSFGSFLHFVNGEATPEGLVGLFPYLRAVGHKPGATDRQRIISMIFANKEHTILESETNLLDALDRVDALTRAEISDRHIFLISQAFEGLLPRLGEKQNDGGQFFTPREVIRVIVKAVNPQVGKTVYDPCCGTGGFLIEAFKHMLAQHPAPTQIEQLKSETFWGREYANEAIPICLANMVLHDIDLPRIWHGNSLTGIATDGALFEDAPLQFDYIMTNPPFGSKEGKDAQAQFAYKTGKGQVLFLQHIIDSLAAGGTCGMVIDEGVLFHTNTTAYQQTKRKLLKECDLWCIISLPPGVFVNAGAGVKTNLVFFTKGRPTQRVWYYDLTDVKVTKKQPLTFEHFDDFFRRLALDPDAPERTSEHSWYVDFETIREKKYDLKAVNPNAPDTSDKRTPQELIDIIKQAQREIDASLEALTRLR